MSMHWYSLGGKGNIKSPHGALSKEAGMGNEKEWERDPNLMQSSTTFYKNEAVLLVSLVISHNLQRVT